MMNLKTSAGRTAPSERRTFTCSTAPANLSTPDAAWIAKSRLQSLDKRSLEGFWHFCPDFVIELRSHYDRLRVLRDKMQEWIANGAQLGWLIDAERRAVEVYGPGREPEIRVDVMSVAGEGPIEGFVLELGPVWEPLGS